MEPDYKKFTEGARIVLATTKPTDTDMKDLINRYGLAAVQETTFKVDRNYNTSGGRPGDSHALLLLSTVSGPVDFTHTSVEGREFWAREFCLESEATLRVDLFRSLKDYD